MHFQTTATVLAILAICLPAQAEMAREKEPPTRGIELPKIASGSYLGTLHCDKLPFTKGPQQVGVDIRVDGSRISYTRSVKNETSTASVGTETGAGTVTANGEAKLSGGWQGARDGYSATYAGRLSASGGKLEGEQNWTYQGQNYRRTCSMSVTAR